MKGLRNRVYTSEYLLEISNRCEYFHFLFELMDQRARKEA